MSGLCLDYKLDSKVALFRWFITKRLQQSIERRGRVGRGGLMTPPIKHQRLDIDYIYISVSVNGYWHTITVNRPVH